MRILFMGTPQFAVNCLTQLYNENYEIAAVVTQPDKPKGRGHKMMPTPVKEKALELSIPVYQPATLKDGAFLQELNSIHPDIIVVVAYGKILPNYIIEYPKFHCVNVHASLLPKYRGAAPIQRCIMDGENETGVTTMLMDTGLDTGDMLLTKKTPILPDETSDELTQKLSMIGAKVLIETLKAIETNSIVPQKQDGIKATYAHMIERDTGLLDFSNPGTKLLNLIRAVDAYTYYNGKKLKVLKARFLPIDNMKKPFGTILKVSPDGVDVSVSDGVLLLNRIQMEGKKAMDVCDYLRGNSIEEGVILSADSEINDLK